MLLKYLLLTTIPVICIQAVCDRDTQLPVEWSGVSSLQWSDDTIRSLYKNSGRLINKNNICTRFVISDDYAYLACPRLKPGVPATVVRVSLKATDQDAVLVPFPCLLSQEEKNCNALQSVVDLYLDTNNILWVLDAGVVNTLTTPIRRCPPKVLGFSLLTGKLVKSIDLSGLVTQTSRLQYIVCEYYKNSRPYLYISDAATRSILVYDVVGGKGYRVVLPKVVSSGCNRKDVLYIALVSRGCGNNYLVFTYLCAKRVYLIRTDDLKSGSTSGRIVDLGPKTCKIVILGTDLGSAIFFRCEGKSEIYRWDVNTCFKQSNFQLVYRSDSCFLATSVAADIKRQQMRVLQSNFPDFVQGTVGCGAVQQINIISGP